MPTPPCRRTLALIAALCLALPLHAGDDAEEPQPPRVGDEAADFTLESLRGGEVALHELTADGPVVLLVLRGFPTYQCPVCSRQVGDFLEHAGTFAEHDARVVMIYPGPAEHLRERAEEFMNDRVMPQHFDLLIDPDYVFTDLYALRWDAPQETAYPSTFVVDGEKVVRFAKVSHTHGGRTKAQEVLDVLTAMRPVE